MSKWAGIIGFRYQTETEPSVWVEDVIEKRYYGDVIKNYRSMNGDSEINDSISLSNQISIISDPYARENFHRLIYLTYMGTKWKVRNIEVQYPRLILTLGGVYNDEN